MKKKTKMDFLAINRMMNGNWNAKGDELKLNRKISRGQK